MTIYCDESGFTGNNMLNEDQPYFSYVGINISHDNAINTINAFLKKYNIAQSELKGQLLLSRGNKYKNAVDELFTTLLDKTKFAISLKRFSLACSFFEYIFEPLISKKSSLFYKSGFHVFIANAIYLSSFISDKVTNDMLDDFENFMRNKDSDLLKLFNERKTEYFDIKHITDFANIHRDVIISEFQGLGITKKWILDNSMTLLYQIICAWTVDVGEISVICDESKPLIASADFFKNFVGRKDQFWREINGEKWPLIAHLSNEITFKESKNEPGLQLADIMASTVTYALKRKKECPYAQRWLEKLWPHITIAVIPDIEYFLTTNVDLWRNVFILEELLNRSKAKECLLTGIENVFNLAHIAAQTATAELVAKAKEQFSHRR